MHVGTSVWPSSLVLAKFVNRWIPTSPSPPNLNPYAHLLHFPNKQAIELGSGCGPTGMAISLLGLTNILVTDIAPVMPALKRNKPLFSKVPKTAQLYWNNHEQLEDMKPSFDFVITTDVVYLEHSARQLVSAMEALVVLTGVFWEMCERTFDVEKVLHEDLHPKYAFEETNVHILRKK